MPPTPTEVLESVLARGRDGAVRERIASCRSRPCDAAEAGRRPLRRRARLRRRAGDRKRTGRAD